MRAFVFVCVCVFVALFCPTHRKNVYCTYIFGFFSTTRLSSDVAMSWSPLARCVSSEQKTACALTPKFDLKPTPESPWRCLSNLPLHKAKVDRVLDDLFHHKSREPSALDENRVDDSFVAWRTAQFDQYSLNKLSKTQVERRVLALCHHCLHILNLERLCVEVLGVVLLAARRRGDIFMRSTALIPGILSEARVCVFCVVYFVIVVVILIVCAMARIPCRCVRLGGASTLTAG